MSGSHQFPIFGIKMLENIGIAGDLSGTMYFFRKSPLTQSEIWGVERVDSGVRSITHIDGDEERLVIGTRNGLHLWDITKMSLIPSEVPVDVYVRMLSFHYPFAFVVGGGRWEGLKMFNMVTGKIERDLSELGSVLYIHSNGRFLVLSVTVRNSRTARITIFDERELMDQSVNDEDLWVKHHEFHCESTMDSIIAVSNMTKLVVTDCYTLKVFDFWWWDKDCMKEQNERSRYDTRFFMNFQ